MSSDLLKEKKGLMIVLSAPSGAGKTTVTESLLKKFPKLVKSLSVTTRRIRRGEINGRDYKFVNECEFVRLIKSRYFIEWANVHGNYYGTPKSVYRNIKKGKDTLFIIDVHGAMNIKKKFPESILIFIMPPSLNELNIRMLKRNTEHAESLRKRLIDAKKEIKYVLKYDYCVVNDKVKDAVQDIISIIIAERLRVKGKRN